VLGETALVYAIESNLTLNATKPFPLSEQEHEHEYEYEHEYEHEHEHEHEIGPESQSYWRRFFLNRRLNRPSRLLLVL